MLCEAKLGSKMDRLISIRMLAIGRRSAAPATCNSEEQILDTLTSLVYQTHLSIMSVDRELWHQPIQAHTLGVMDWADRGRNI
jgi:hypothetical protein